MKWGGAIRGIETGIKIPESIVAGETPVLVAILNKPSVDDTYREVVGLTIKKTGTYKFSICAYGTGGYGYLRKNGSNVQDFDNYGWTSITVNCQVGDRITLVTRDSTHASITVYCFIATIKWDIGSIFTSYFLTSERMSYSTSSTSMTASGIYVNIPKTATYKIIFRASTGGIVKEGTFAAQLYKNGVAINGATAVWDGKQAEYNGNISCTIGDRLEIYCKSRRDSSINIGQLSAEEIIN